MSPRQSKFEKNCQKCGWPLSACNCKNTAVGDRNRREAQRILDRDKRRKQQKRLASLPSHVNTLHCEGVSY